jgi:hypothetical protein
MPLPAPVMMMALSCTRPAINGSVRWSASADGG